MEYAVLMLSSDSTKTKRQTLLEHLMSNSAGAPRPIGIGFRVPHTLNPSGCSARVFLFSADRAALLARMPWRGLLREGKLQGIQTLTAKSRDSKAYFVLENRNFSLENRRITVKI